MAYGDNKKPPQALRDFDPMPNGKHKGTQMKDVPAKYLMYIYDNKTALGIVRGYILDNLEDIKEAAIKEGYDPENFLD